MAKAIAYHSGSLFIDFSPYNDEVQQNNAGSGQVKEIQKVVQQVFKAARDYGPAVIYMDNVDLYLVKKVRGTNTNVKMKNELKKSFTKMTDRMQIVVIGCINIAPAKITSKDLEMFSRKIFFPLPQFADLKLLWKH